MMMTALPVACSRAVGGAVVDEDDLARPVQGQEDGFETPSELGKRLPLVQDRYDERVLRAHAA